MTTLEIIAAISGWISFSAWALSFLPQAILNYRRKSVSGFSLEFALLNVSGFYFYALYSTGGTINWQLGTGKVEINDLVFGWYAFVLASVQFAQAFMYERGD